MNLPVLYRTLRHLQPVQMTNRLARRLPQRITVPDLTVRPRTGLWVAPIAHEPAPLTRPSRLRDYTLHYHHRPTQPQVLDWIAANPPAVGPGWEPYPLSRRIVNWIKWLLAESRPSANGVLLSLAAQAARLSATLEYHLLANHLFANAKALAFAGALFEARKWLKQGLAILDREIPEQILPDGGHFERSPMYHALVLEDLLDLVNLSHAYPGLLPDFSETAGRMLAWLDRMSHPDGEIAFFNDAAFSVAPPLAALQAYASRLDLRATSHRLEASGYLRLENPDTVVLFDAAPIGPDYQPGHAHADTLSFELSHQGRRLLVNSGTSTYENNVERHAQRGTAAHNTVRIDGRDSSEVWAAFRVGRRARPFDVHVCLPCSAEAAHDGYKPVIHRRRLHLEPGRLLVADSIEGRGEHEIEIFFHLHPEADPSIVKLHPALSPAVRDTTWHPQFDAAVPNKTVIGRWQGVLPMSFLSEVRVHPSAA